MMVDHVLFFGPPAQEICLFRCSRETVHAPPWYPEEVSELPDEATVYPPLKGTPDGC